MQRMNSNRSFKVCAGRKVASCERPNRYDQNVMKKKGKAGDWAGRDIRRRKGGQGGQPGEREKCRRKRSVERRKREAKMKIGVREES